MNCYKYIIINTGSTEISFNYRRCDDTMWEYQVSLKPNQVKNVWLIDNTFSTAFENSILFINKSVFPPINIIPTPTQTPTNTSTPTPTPTQTPTVQVLINPIITDNDEYILVSESFYLMYD